MSLTVISANGCQDSVTHNVQVYHNPSVSFGSADLCLSDSLTLTDATTVGAPSIISGWQWDFGDGNIASGQNPGHQYSSPGVYSVILDVITDHGCIGSDTVVVTAYDHPQAGFATMDVCQDQSASFTNLSLAPSDGSIGSFNWDFGDGNQDNMQFQPTHNYTLPGTYQVSLTVNSSNLNCPDTFIQQITVHPVPTADFTFNDTCQGKDVSFMDGSAGSINTWTWDFGDGNTATGSSPVHGFNMAGTYNANLTVVSNFGCSDSVSKIITIWPLPIPEFTTMNVCLGQRTFMYDLSSIVNPYLISGLNWDFGDGTTGTGSVTNNVYQQAGDYTITLSASSDKGCIDSVKKVVQVNHVPEAMVEFSIVEGCMPLCVNIKSMSKIMGLDSIASILWQFGDGGMIVGENANYCFTHPGFYDVNLQVTSSSGCVSEFSFQDTIKVYDHPTADFGYTPQIVSLSQPIVTFLNNSSSDATSFLWDFGSDSQINGSTERNPVHIYSSAGTFVTTLWVENSHGCMDSITREVIIQSDVTLYIPNAFTPNSDGLNDQFKPEGRSIIDYEMLIFNRWGELIFKTDNLAIGWDGMVKGIDGEHVRAQIDVYIYKIRARGLSFDSLIEETGFLHLFGRVLLRG